MAKLLCKNKVILPEMKYITSVLSISKGLMFASKKKIRKGVCLVLPFSNNRRTSAAVTMLFCFYPMEILFVNSKFKVVDKVVLKPWRFSYVPKEACKYVIESSVGRFKEVKIGDRVKIMH